MSDIPTNCPNCSAPINMLHNKCKYCDTPYPWKAEAETVTCDLRISTAEFAEAVRRSFMTPNEMRRRHGLRDI